MGRHIHARVFSKKGCKIRITHVHACSDCVYTRDDTVRLDYASRFVRIIHSSRIVSIKLGTVTDLHSIFTLLAQVVTSNTGPILVFPLTQPFGSDKLSSLSSVYSRQATESVNCENYSVSFVMKYCPISTTLRNPASVKNFLTLSCCDNSSIRSQYLCSRSFSCARSLFKGMFVLITLGTNKEVDCPLTKGLSFLS